MTAEFISDALRGRRCGSQWLASCPAHEADGRPHNPSLGIREKGGKILVCCRAGCSQAEVIAALKARGLWPESERPSWTPQQRAEWRRQQLEVERDLPGARLWVRSALLLGGELLDQLKIGLFDPDAEMQPGIAEVKDWTARLARWRRIEGGELVQEFRMWLEQHPGMTAGLVRWSKSRERAELRALRAYLRATDPRRLAA